MSLNRRQFFGSFWGADYRRTAERKARVESLEGYAWTNLLPFDFSLNDEQFKQLTELLRTLFAKATDDELFSPEMPRRLEELVNALVVPWREEYYLRNPN